MDKPGICLVMFGAPFDNVKERLYRRCTILEAIGSRLLLIIDDMPHGIELNDTNIINLRKKLPKRPKTCNWLAWAINYIFKHADIQISILKNILLNREKIDLVIFATGIPHVLPTIICCRLLGKKTIILGGGTAYYSSIAGKGKITLGSSLIWLPEQFCYLFSNTIAVETEQSAYFLHLTKFGKRVKVFGPFTYIDTDALYPLSNASSRDNVVGFISNLYIGKGILNLIEAEIEIAKQRPDVSFFIGGSGPLFDQINTAIQDGGYEKRFTIAGQIPHEKIGKYLNQLKLLVLPSYSEGLPTIILEAMATGTIVLVTPVGGVPDIIQHDVNGFIISNNCPKNINDDICFILNHPGLDRIAENAKLTITTQYSYQATIERYRKVFFEIANE